MRTKVKGWVDTDNEKLNAVLGHPTLGIPLGRLVEIYGGESHGKTALLYHLLGKVQERGGLALLFDNDGSFDEDWASKFLDPKKLIFIQLGDREVKKGEFSPEGMEDLFLKFSTTIAISKKEYPGTPIFIGWDDVAGTLTRKEIEDEYGSEGVALAPRVLSRGLKKLKSELHDTHVSILCLNQFRTKIATGFGYSTNITTGGRAMKYYAAVRTKISRTSTRAGYITCVIKNEKNKTSPPFKDLKVKINFEEGLVF